MPSKSRLWMISALAAGIVALWAIWYPMTDTEKAGPGPPVLTPVPFSELPGWPGDDHAAGLDAFKRYCPSLSRRDTGPLAAPRAWQRLCAALNNFDGPPRAFIEAQFNVWAVGGKDHEPGLFTGYYEPELRGSRSAGGPYQTPLYARPDDLVEWEQSSFLADAGLGSDVAVRRLAGRVENGELKPYYTRAEIESGVLAGRGLELLWVDHPVDAFFLQIQGSGRIVLEDGTTVRVGYDGQNGRPYRAIGRDLEAQGVIAQDAVSMQTIRAWLAAHPDQARETMNRNPSFVFFREITELTADQGPLGAAGIPLIAGRSLAVDPRYWPYGLPLWLDTTLAGGENRPYQRLMIAGDTGGAIKGPVRGDIFFGGGADAARLAGPMKQPGKLYILVPKDLKLDARQFAVSKRDP